ncbi:MAG: serine protease, partial [Cyanobacteria bacterium P01_A01_bin.68]
MTQKLTLYTSIIGSLLLFQTPIIAIKPDYLISQAATKASSCEIVPEDEVDGKYSQQQLQILASRITMRVMGNENGGSGTIIAKHGNKYLVVTNSHVIQGVNSISLQAFDGKNYAAKIVPNTNFEKFDLALLEFQTNQNYCLPEVADFLPNEEMKVVASGFSGKKDKIVFRQGKVRQISSLPLKGGYSIGYSSNIDQGMSGGAIINTQGTLIGINGKSAYPILNTG